MMLTTDTLTRKDQDTLKASWDTIVIGGGQAGLVTGYYLQRLNRDFLILDANKNTGDSWRNRWDSLCLFTPAWLNGLPGMPFPGSAEHFPAKEEVADFLLSYKQKFDLPVRYDHPVTSLVSTPQGYRVTTKERVLFAKNVIVATGAYIQPKIPAFAGRLDESIFQLHSSAYTNPKELPNGDTLIVGSGTSGLQIAMDIRSDGRKVVVAGNPPAHIPDFVFRFFARQFVWLATNVLNTGTPMGRKARQAIKTKGGGAPLINISMKDIDRAGIRHVSRIAGQRDGWPVTDKDDQLKVSAIIWATGFSPDYSWIQIPGCFDEQGYPLTERGISIVADGLYFVGSMFQYGLTSTWLGGVGRDADFVCRYLAKRQIA